MFSITTGLPVYYSHTIGNLERIAPRFAEVETAVYFAAVPPCLMLFLMPCIIWEIMRAIAAESALTRKVELAHRLTTLLRICPAVLPFPGKGVMPALIKTFCRGN